MVLRGVYYRWRLPGRGLERCLLYGGYQVRGLEVKHWTTEHGVVGSPPAYLWDASHHAPFMSRRLIGPIWPN